MKRNLYMLAAAAVIGLGAVSCGPSARITRAEQYPKMYEARPVTLLVMPPINQTSNVEAKEYLYTSISRPLAEAGYYVISPMLAMDVLKAESAYDSELFVDAPLKKFQEFFGADAIVFSEIKTWTKQGFSIKTKIRYFIKSAYTNEIIFDRTCDLTLDLSMNLAGSNSGFVGSLVNLAASAINTAATDHIRGAREANYYIFRDIPRGKYNPLYEQDKEFGAEKCDVSAYVK